MIECLLEFSYSSPDEAEAVLRAVAIDNEGFVEAAREGSRLISRIQAGNPKALLHTLEDYLSCVAVAEGTAQGHA